MKTKFFGLIGSAWGQRITFFAAIMIVMAIFQPVFFSWSNLLSILFAIAIYGIMACGMLFVVLVGGIDFSIGSMAALSACIALTFTSHNAYSDGSVIIAILISLSVAIVVGVIHGLFDAVLKLPAFVVTLATQYMLYSLADMHIGSKYVHLTDTNNLYYAIGNLKVFSIPMPVIIFIVFAAITAFVLTKTTFGRRLYAAGGNRRAASLVGINTKLYTVCAYIICAVAAAISGIVLSSMNLTASYVTARGYEGTVMMAVVVGGVNIMGGQGSVSGVIFGALLVGVLNNVIILLGISTDYSELVQGVVIVAAVALNVYGATKKRRII
ncbi:MAG: ABC transporter permease [Oscillospiraceae bacterium]|jgi:ribose/xylose/arabinose/galactoside ABC-type transport system permease subunit|nr:ABC transporter permease [Oscillospiraceae bacterium]